MLDPDLSEDEVQCVLTGLAGDDAGIGRLAAGAWMSLTAGEGPGMVTLAGLQIWLWWLLPKRSHRDAYDQWVGSAEAAAVLFDRLGCRRYAEVCRSDTTARVLGAWRESRSKGLAATRKALAASPVEPPDLEGFAWSTVFGPWENDARSAVEWALEQALDDGRLDPTAKGWRKTAARICAEALDQDHPGQVGQGWRALVLTERAAEWATGARIPPDQRDHRQRLASRFIAPPEPPLEEVTVGPLGLLGWLADACSGGVTLTTSGYLPRALVVAAADTFGWWEWDKPPRSEADVWQLRILHRAGQQLGVVRRRARTLTTTKAGRTVATDPATWWPRLVLLDHGKDAYRDAVFEALALALIDAATYDVDALGQPIGQLLAAQGWQTSDGPLDAEAHGRHLYMAINPWRMWGFVDYDPGRWGPTPDGPRRLAPTTITATPAGLAAAHLWLHHHITRPRHDV